MRMDERDDRAFDGREKFWLLFPAVLEASLISKTGGSATTPEFEPATKSIRLNAREMKSRGFLQARPFELAGYFLEAF